MADLDLFTAPAPTHAELEHFIPERPDRTVDLVLIALELALKAKQDGVTVANVRLAAVQRGFLTGNERREQLCWLGSVMKKAGLVATGRTRRSHVERSHGNRHTVWVRPEYVCG